MRAVVGPTDVLEMQALAQEVYVAEELLDYVLGARRVHARARDASTSARRRAPALALVHASKGLALLAGRDYVLPDDVRHLAPMVLGHRILMTPEAELEGALGTRSCRRGARQGRLQDAEAMTRDDRRRMIPRLATRGKLVLGTALLFLVVGALHGAPPLVALAGVVLAVLLALYLAFYPTAILLRRKKIELSWWVPPGDQPGGALAVDRPFQLHLAFRNHGSRKLRILSTNILAATRARSSTSGRARRSSAASRSRSRRRCSRSPPAITCCTARR